MMNRYGHFKNNKESKQKNQFITKRIKYMDIFLSENQIVRNKLQLKLTIVTSNINLEQIGKSIYSK